MDENYSKYFDIYLKEKSLYLSGKTKYQKCPACENNKIFTEKNNELIYSCGSTVDNCGDQLKIKLPEYVNYLSEIMNINDIINGSFNYTSDYENLSEYNLHKLSKYIKIPTELATQEKNIKEQSEKLENYQSLFLKENNIKKRNESIQDLYQLKMKGMIQKRKLLSELKLKKSVFKMLI